MRLGYEGGLWLTLSPSMIAEPGRIAGLGRSDGLKGHIDSLFNSVRADLGTLGMSASRTQRWEEDSPLLPHFALRIVPFWEFIVPTRRRGMSDLISTVISSQSHEEHTLPPEACARHVLSRFWLSSWRKWF